MSKIMHTPSDSRRNILLLTIDAWRPDFIDAYEGIPLTPTLRSLQQQTVRFSRAYATAPWTSPAIISLLTGQSALHHGVHYEWSAPRPGTPALAARLAAAGYRVPNLCYLNRVGNYHHLGYDPAAAPGYPSSPDDDLLPQTLRRLADAPKTPFFIWYHYKFVHLPYWPQARYRKLMGVEEDAVPARVRDSVGRLFVVPRFEYPLLPEDRAIVRALYAGAVRQMDDFLARVFAALDVTGQLARTTVVLTADHGEELLEHGHVGHASTSHYATLYEEVLRVPLLFIDARIAAARTIAVPVQGSDLFPTILRLAGEEPQPADSAALDLSGLVLDPAAEPPAALAPDRLLAFHCARMGYQTPQSHKGHVVTGFIAGRQKYIFEQYESPRRLLYDLAADPTEQSALTHGPAVEAAHARLLALQPDFPRP